MQLQVHPIKFAKPFITRIPQIESLKLSQVLNSEVACRVCRGVRKVAINSEAGKFLGNFTVTGAPLMEAVIYVKECGFCKGSGTMFNRIGYYDSR